MPANRVGPGKDNRQRLSVLYDVIKGAGVRGIYLDDLRKRANERLDARLKIRSHEHLAFLLHGWRKGQNKVGGYLSGITEPVPGTPGNVHYLRLKKGTRKREFMQGLSKQE